MTQPVPITGSSTSSTAANGDETQQQLAKPPTTQAKTTRNGRGRSQSWANSRLDANGNATFVRDDTPKSPKLSSSPSISGSVPGSGILSLLGLSPRSTSSNHTHTPFSAVSSSTFSANPEASPASSVTSIEEATTPPQHYEDLSLERKTSHTIFELDEDVFDEDTTTVPGYRSRGPSSHHRSVSLGGDPFGRRASYPGPTSENSNEDVGSNDGSSVMSWLNGQKASQAAATSLTYANYNARDSGFRDSSNPVGIFRRLSLSSRRPAPVPPPSSTSGMSDTSERVGRPADKPAAPAPRKLSPLSKRMLLAHYHDFS